jgi:replicative DNA helicase
MIQDTLDFMTKNRKRKLEGKYNAIPFGFPRFEQFLPGLEQEKFYCITANSGIGKSKLSKFVSCISPYFQYQRNPHLFDFSVLYFSLEESKQYFMMNIISALLWYKYQIRKDVKELSSIYKPLDDRVLKLINEESATIADFLSKVTVNVDAYTPYEIFKTAIHHLEQQPKDQYNIIVVDHIGLMHTDKKHRNTRDAMVEFTSKYALALRDKFRATVIAVQQQAAESEDITHYKEQKMEPSLQGLGDAKVCARDYNVVMGLFAPHKYGFRNYRGYNVEILQDSFRDLSIIKNREGESNIHVPLLFDGAANYFNELPPLNTEELKKLYVNKTTKSSN